MRTDAELLFGADCAITYNHYRGKAEIVRNVLISEVVIVSYQGVVEKFQLRGAYSSCEPYGDGHINDTFLVVMNENGCEVKYILQRLNSNVFPRTKELMENVIAVTDYLCKTIAATGGNPDRDTLTLAPLKTGEKYYVDDDGKYWRVYIYIDNSIGLQKVEDKSVFEGAGNAFGSFIGELDKYPADTLHEVIFDFHNTAARFDNFCKSLDTDYSNRSLTCSEDIRFVLDRKNYCGRIIDALTKGELPLRVTHNDTKLNNVLLDKDTGKPICVIDLDTIMPGSLLYDFGDAIRSGCNTGLEDEKDLSKVNFSIELFESFVKGFTSGIGDTITAKESEMLSFGAILMTFECGMRFLTDYLEGDKYFKTQYSDHNLVRCRTQFKLVSEMEKVLNNMNAIVAKYTKL